MSDSLVFPADVTSCSGLLLLVSWYFFFFFLLMDVLICRLVYNQPDTTSILYTRHYIRSHTSPPLPLPLPFPSPPLKRPDAKTPLCGLHQSVSSKPDGQTADSHTSLMVLIEKEEKKRKENLIVIQEHRALLVFFTCWHPSRSDETGN